MIYNFAVCHLGKRCLLLRGPHLDCLGRRHGNQVVNIQQGPLTNVDMITVEPIKRCFANTPSLIGPATFVTLLCYPLGSGLGSTCKVGKENPLPCISRFPPRMRFVDTALIMRTTQTAEQCPTYRAAGRQKLTRGWSSALRRLSGGDKRV